MHHRRSTRVAVVLPVVLRGTDFHGVAFEENTWTMGVNIHGGKLSTSHRLTAGDEVVVGNPVLGKRAMARVSRVMEEGRAFEIGVELFEPQDVWGVKAPPDDWMRLLSTDAAGQGRVSTADAPGRQQPVELGGAATPLPEETARSLGPPEAVSAHPPAPLVDEAELPPPASLPDAASLMQGGNSRAASSSPQFDSLLDFLRASRAEIETLLAKTQEIQRLSSRAIQSLLEVVHVRLHQELEAAAASFANDTRNRVQHEASVALEAFGNEAKARQAALLDDALAQSQASHQRIELSLKESAETYQKHLEESSASALKQIQHQGEGLFSNFRIELQKTLEELKKKVVHEVSEQLRGAGQEMTDELRRRAEVGYEILNEQLKVSGKTLVEEVQRQIDAFSQAALAHLNKEAYDTVYQQLGFGTTMLKEATDQTKTSLEAHSRQVIAGFQKDIGELSDAALEKYRTTSEFLLHDLQNRLEQAARALQVLTREAVGTPQPNKSD